MLEGYTLTLTAHGYDKFRLYFGDVDYNAACRYIRELLEYGDTRRFDNGEGEAEQYQTRHWRVSLRRDEKRGRLQVVTLYPKFDWWRLLDGRAWRKVQYGEVV